MSKITINKKSNYTTIDNNIFRNKNLSLKARGLLTTMLSLPDEWDYTVKGLCSILKDGKSSIQSALRELEENGYLVRIQTKDKSGKFSSTDYTLYEIPLAEKPLTENPSTDNPPAENPSTENQPQLNTNRLNTNELNKYKENTNIENTKNKASTNVEVSYKALSRTSGNKVADQLPYEYTQEQFDEFIKGRVSDIVKKNFPDNKEEIEPISKIISYFYEQYLDNIGERHPVMSDAIYLGIVKKLLNPIDAIWRSDDRLNVLGYEAMVDRFFETDYGEKSGNHTDYRIGYFFSDTVMENLYYRELY